VKIEIGVGGDDLGDEVDDQPQPANALLFVDERLPPVGRLKGRLNLAPVGSHPSRTTNHRGKRFLIDEPEGAPMLSSRS